ncbi:MAG: YlbF family regulator [Planctomycetota bacterium]
MPDTPAIVSQARRLGEMIAEHDAAKRLETALKALDDDLDAQRALTDLNRHLQAIAEKERDGKPIEVDEKRKAEELQKAVVRSKTLRDLQLAQMDYGDLMRQVQAAIETGTPDAPPPPTG